ncbi:unnamed protein product [Ranitomeya imitator]|uniref:Transposase n=1 Tax=Ranitomeya imitator TaxID=111125 RepID=A0ABN9KUL8_9NEOB|nr:unnamed protein product [Ranitomeya imitator]
MQDNARPHVAGVCQQFLRDEGIEAMDWPVRSPDLNPIEHIWDIMSRPIHQQIRLKKLMDERESFLEQAIDLEDHVSRSILPHNEHRKNKKKMIKKLKGQLGEKSSRNQSPENPDNENMENGTDVQRDANRQINDLKFKLTKSTQEITALEQNIIRLESQLTRYKSSAENAEKVEDELKAEKRRLQREVNTGYIGGLSTALQNAVDKPLMPLRAALDKIEELEVGNSHLIKRLEKMKANRSAILSQQ